MALETGVDIKIEVSGEKLLKQAFDSVRLAAKGLETQGMSLSETLKKLEGTEKETINTFRKSSDTYKGLQKETVNLAKQYEFMAKFSGISAKEARMLALAQDDLLKKAKELNLNTPATIKYMEGQNKKIVEQIRLNNQLSSSIEQLSAKSQKNADIQKRLQKELFANDDAVALFRANELKKQKQAEESTRVILKLQEQKLQLEKTMGDGAVALFRANEIRKQKEVERTNSLLMKQEQERLARQAGTGDQMVALFRANEMAKQRELEKTSELARRSQEAQTRSIIETQKAAQQLAQNQLNQIQKELVDIQKQSELTAKGLSRVTASGVVRLEGMGATKQQIDQFIRLRKEIETLDPSVRKVTASFAGMSSVVRQIIPTVGAIGIGSALTQTAIAAIRTADSMSLLKSRMRLTLDETQNFEEVYQNLVETAINNRASLTDTVTLFNRLSPALKAAGVETGNVDKVIDSFQKTLLISGATVRETSSAILQFSQAMAAGRLNGDEFRSISEAAPEFLRAFSRATGVAAGSLKELASEGALTTEVITAAMVVMNEELGKLAKGIDLTFGQSIQILGTRLAESVDRLNEATGFTKALADSTFALSNIVKSATDFIVANKDTISALTSVLGEAISALGFVAGAYVALKAATVAWAGATAGAALIMKGATIALASYAATGSVATTATIALTAAVRGLLASTGIGALAVILGTAGVALYDYVAGSEDAKVASTELKQATEEETRAIEEARVVLSNFGITYGAASGATGEYKKKTEELTDAYIKQAVGAEGLYLIQKNMLELKRAQILTEASAITFAQEQTETDIKKRDELHAQADALTELLGILELTEQQRKDIEKNKKADKTTTKQIKEIDKLRDSIKSLEDKYVSYGGRIDDIQKVEREIVEAFEKGKISAKEYTDQLIRLSEVRERKSEQEYAKAQAEAAVEMNKVYEATEEQTKAYKDQVAEIEEQILKVGKQEEALLALELAKIDDIIATKQQKIEMNSFGDANDTLIGQYKEQIVELEKLKKAKSKLYETQEAQKVIEANAKIAKQLEDDIVKAFEKAFLEGANLAESLKKSIKATFAKEVFRIFVQPIVGGITGTISNALGVGGSGQQGGLGQVIGGSKGIFDNLGSFGAGKGFGIDAGNFTDGFLALGDSIANTFGDSALSDAIINNSELLGKVSAGLAAVGTGLSVFDSLKDGRYGSAIGEGVGYYFGGSIGGAIGKTLGGFVDKIFGFGGKISATALPASFGQNVVENLNKQYSDITTSLGGTALGGVSFGAGGNTGRQGQNPNFTIGASIGNRGVFNSRNTREGQADGLFLAGEIALNEANLADQSLRALFSVLKETDFADNIDAVIDSVDTFGDSFEKLQTALSDAQLLRTINEEFPKLGGALATLAGQSIETVKTFVLLAGGFENLQSMQNAYIGAIYSEEEKLALATQNLQSAFDALGIAVPNTTADFRALVEAQNLTTVEGQATYLALLQLSGAFKEIKDAQQQALEEQVAEQERLLEDQKRAAEEAAEALRELAEAYDELNKKTQDYIFEITNGALTSLERNAQEISQVMSELGSEQDAMEMIALQSELSDLIFERYQLEKEQIEELQSLIAEVFSAIQTEADSVNQARDSILGVQTTTGSRSSIASRIAQATGGAAFNATAAQANLTAEIERFKTSSLNAVSVLGKLREETVRYYEQQKALSELMKGTASSIRASISQVQFADLTPQQQLQNLEAQFSSLYATALTSSGSTLANTGAELQSLIGPLLEKASEIYASGPEFQRIKELVLGQAGTVADKLDSLAPENYQQESLGLLDQIDQSLIGLMNQADLANQALIASLETASDRAVAALNNLMFGLTGQAPVNTQPVIQPALNAPTATLASSEFSGNSATTGGSFGAIVDELKALREDVRNSGDIQIKVVTTDGRVLVDETLTQIKTRSKRGELVIYADGVK